MPISAQYDAISPRRPLFRRRTHDYCRCSPPFFSIFRCRVFRQLRRQPRLSLNTILFITDGRYFAIACNRLPVQIDRHASLFSRHGSHRDDVISATFSFHAVSQRLSTYVFSDIRSYLSEIADFQLSRLTPYFLSDSQAFRFQLLSNIACDIISIDVRRVVNRSQSRPWRQPAPAAFSSHSRHSF